MNPTRRRSSLPPAPRTLAEPVLLVNGSDAQNGELLRAAARAGGLVLDAVSEVEAWDYLTSSGAYSSRGAAPAPVLIVYFSASGEPPRRLLQRLRASAPLRRIPFVALTPEGKPCPRTESLRLGPVLYRKRPAGSYEAEDLIADLRRLLGVEP